MSGNYPEQIVDMLTSYHVQGYLFSKAYKKKHWDGKRHLYSKSTKSIPFGLVDIVVEGLKKYTRNRITIEIDDVREKNKPLIQENGFELDGVQFGEGKYDYQKEAVLAFLEKRRGIIKIATNGGKGILAIALIKHLGIRTLYVVPGLDLLSQVTDDLSSFCSINKSSIGQIGSGKFEIGKWVTVASIDSLTSRYESGDLEKYKDYWDLIISDECHTASEARISVFDYLESYYRLGMSATPLNRTDGANLDIISQFGNVIYEVSNKLLVERGISAIPTVKIIKIDKPILPDETTWPEAELKGIIRNEQLNNAVVSETVSAYMEGKQVVIIVDKIEHGDILIDLFDKSFVAFQATFINGERDTKEERKYALDQFKAYKSKILIATNILSTGLNIPNIDVLIYASSGKSVIRTLQRSGRGLRKTKGKDEILIIDFANFCHKHLTKHSLERLNIYKSQECFNIVT